MKNNTEVNSLKSKELYKATLALLKRLPMIMAFSYLMMLFCFNFIPEYVIIPHILGTIVPMMTFLYITSYVFKFCAFHRLFIHYYVFIDILNVTDHYFCNYLNEGVVTFLHDSGTIIFLITALVMYIYKYKKDKCAAVIESCNKEVVTE